MQEITQVRSAATALVTYMVQMKARGALSGEFSAGSSAKLYAAIRSMAAFSKVVAEHDAEGRIVQLEDRWKGLPLLDSPPFTWARRLNGVMSFWLTPLLKADEFE